MLRSLVKRYGMGGIIFMGSLCQPWPAQAGVDRIDAGTSTNINITVEGDILANCSLTALNSLTTIDMGKVEMVWDTAFPVKPLTGQPIRLQGDCINTTGAWISVDADAIDRDDGSIFLNNLSPGEGVASGVGTWVNMTMSYTDGITRDVEKIQVGEQYMLQPATDAADDNILTLEFTAQLVYLEGVRKAYPGRFSSTITFNLMVP